MIKINTTFVTPFDREDIYRPASALDDVLDAIEEAADRIVLYRLGTLPDGIGAQVEVLQRAAAATGEAMPRLEKMAELRSTGSRSTRWRTRRTTSTGRCWATCSPRPRARRLGRAHGAQDQGGGRDPGGGRGRLRDGGQHRSRASPSRRPEWSSPRSSW
jgi:hypothetical protein